MTGVGRTVTDRSGVCIPAAHGGGYSSWTVENLSVMCWVQMSFQYLMTSDTSLDE